MKISFVPLIDSDAIRSLAERLVVSPGCKPGEKQEAEISAMVEFGDQVARLALSIEAKSHEPCVDAAMHKISFMIQAIIDGDEKYVLDRRYIRWGRFQADVKAIIENVSNGENP